MCAHKVGVDIVWTAFWPTFIEKDTIQMYIRLLEAFELSELSELFEPEER